MEAPHSIIPGLPTWVLGSDVLYSDWQLHSTQFGSRVSYSDWRRGVRPPGYKPGSLAKARAIFNEAAIREIHRQLTGRIEVPPVAKSAEPSKKGSSPVKKSSIKKAARANARAAAPRAKVLEREFTKALSGMELVQRGASLADMISKSRNTEEARAIVRLAGAAEDRLRAEKALQDAPDGDRLAMRNAQEARRAAGAQQAVQALALLNARTGKTFRVVAPR